MRCSFPDCTREQRSSGQPLCEGHYYQRRRGNPLTPLIEKRFGPRPCSIEGCETVIPNGSLCAKHEARVRRHGDPNVCIPQSERNYLSGPDHPRWNEEGTYHGVHQRLIKTLGRANELTCACGAKARQWSYVGPREPGERLPFSTDLSLYEPRCVPCHKQSDMETIRQIEGAPLQ